MPCRFLREPFFQPPPFRLPFSMILPDTIAHQVAQLFARMDQAYDQVAISSGFECNGCHENCCQTRFYHHTLVELLYLKSGLVTLPAAQQKRILKRAQVVLRHMSDLERRNLPVRVMCPLNEGQRCTLYTQRPMICRLHGIPHALRRPDGQVQTGPGCDDFYVQCGKAHGSVLERAPLYMEMAKIERALRQTLGFNGKIKMTIAEMIIEDGFSPNELENRKI